MFNKAAVNASVSSVCQFDGLSLFHFPTCFFFLGFLIFFFLDYSSRQIVATSTVDNPENIFPKYVFRYDVGNICAGKKLTGFFENIYSVCVLWFRTILMMEIYIRIYMRICFFLFFFYLHKIINKILAFLLKIKIISAYAAFETETHSERGECGIWLDKKKYEFKCIKYIYIYMYIQMCFVKLQEMEKQRKAKATSIND